MGAIIDGEDGIEVVVPNSPAHLALTLVALTLLANSRGPLGRCALFQFVVDVGGS